MKHNKAKNVLRDRQVIKKTLKIYFLLNEILWHVLIDNSHKEHNNHTQNIWIAFSLNEHFLYEMTNNLDKANLSRIFSFTSRYIWSFFSLFKLWINSIILLIRESQIWIGFMENRFVCIKRHRNWFVLRLDETGWWKSLEHTCASQSPLKKYWNFVQLLQRYIYESAAAAKQPWGLDIN